MSRRFSICALILSAFMLAGMAKPSWARFRGRVGVFIGPGAYWYADPYYYDPYWYPYAPYPYPYYPYYYYYDPDVYYAPDDVPNEPYPPAPAPSEHQAPETPPARDDSRHDLRFIEGQINRERDLTNYYYQDGDITQEQRDQAVQRLQELNEKARAEAKANGGFITSQEEKAFLNELHRLPSSSSR